MRRSHLTPSFNPVGRLVHLAHGRDVRFVIVDGRVVAEDGRATLVDQDAILREREAACRRLWQRVTGVDPRIQFAPRSWSA
jgi:5-methylthioadenosine/S-adenosylhomocysteine deaminase